MATNLRDVLAPIKINSVRHFFIIVKTNSLIDGIKKWKEILEQEAAKDKSTITIRVQKSNVPGEIVHVSLTLSGPGNFLKDVIAEKKPGSIFEVEIPLDSPLHGKWTIESKVKMKFFTNASLEAKEDTFPAKLDASWPAQNAIFWTILIEGDGSNQDGSPKYVFKLI